MRIVADSSVIIDYLRDGGSPETPWFLDPTEHIVAVPALCDAEVIGGLARQVRMGVLDQHDAAEALIDYVSFPFERHHHLSHVGRIWQLRDNLTAADATYVALAESLDASLLTKDRRLAAAAREHTSVPVLP